MWTNAEVAAVLLVERSGANVDKWEDDIEKVVTKAKQSIIGLAQELVQDDMIPPEPPQKAPDETTENA